MIIERRELLDCTAKLHKRIVALEAENKAVRERVEKAEAACAEMRSILEDTRRCNLGSPDGIPLSWFIRRDKALASDRGQPLLDRMKAMQELCGQLEHDCDEYSGKCFADCPACRWEALKRPKT